MRKHVIALTTANVIVLIAGAFSYFAYSYLLTPSEFGLYGIAFSVSRLGMVLLDGGIKTTLIKHKGCVSAKDETLLTLICMLLGISVMLVIVGLGLFLVNLDITNVSDTLFVLSLSAIYMLTFPLIIIPTSRMEKNLQYKRLSIIEGIAMSVELAGAVPFLVYTTYGLWGFVLAAISARAIRVISLHYYEPIAFSYPTKWTVLKCLVLIKEGMQIQVSSFFSLARDSLHVILIAPIFGKEWSGYYAWALQLCMITSRVFVATSARISVPIYSGEANYSKRWSNNIRQITLLSAITVPILLSLWMIAPLLNVLFFDNKWDIAITLLPLLFFRMLIGSATAPLFSLVLVSMKANVAMKANIVWSLIELSGALFFIYLYGAYGLAVSYALFVISGVWSLSRVLPNYSLKQQQELFFAIMNRPSLYIVILAVMVVYWSRPYLDIPIYWHQYFILSTAILLLVVSLVFEFRNLKRLGIWDKK